MGSREVRQAFVKSIPVMAGYVILGIGFGILLRNAGYGVLWSFAMGAFIYAGSMQYVGVGLLAGGASVLTTALTTFMVNARHLFYSISMIDRYKGAGRYKPYLIFALTDETYSLLCDGTVPRKARTPTGTASWVSLFNHSYWDRAVCWEPVGAGAAFFHRKHRVFHDGAVHRVLHGAVAHGETACRRWPGWDARRARPGGVRAGALPDPG